MKKKNKKNSKPKYTKWKSQAWFDNRKLKGIMYHQKFKYLTN